ncbi:hypothetical protein DLM45_02525 [Hyphomicrobium methylovorum]|uniref:hypothetical protein n=1 Tax=Hyphomicrobium methylovorum TaxID=84 RepID=UPI0015E65552|nr:hypothetical protein [Hyphomicrobium methylovorum]MBA2125101.1 hypothetical protein [Hyphomicrobium methylovorum]
MSKEDSIQSDTERSASSERSTEHWCALEEFAQRDLKSYQSHRERTAYRAGLSMAAAVCDHVAVDYGASKPVTKKAANRFVVAQICGDRIMGFHQQVKSSDDRDVDTERAGVSVNQTTEETE